MSNRVNTSDLASLFVQRLRDNASLQIEGISIICRASDGYINATQLCKAANNKSKTWYEWQRTASNTEFLNELSRSQGIPCDVLVKSNITGPNETRGTWVHPQIAINIAQWISPAFDVKVSKWIYELLVCGNVTYGAERPDTMVYNEYMQQLQNTINQQANQLREKDTMIQYKDTKIDTLEMDMKRLIEQNEELKRQTDILISNSQNMQLSLISTNDKLTLSHNELVNARQTIESTHYIVQDLASRAVPIVNNPQVKEVLMIFLVKEPNTVFTNQLTMRGVQQRNADTAISEVRRKYKDGNYKLIKSYTCSPNSILLKAAIRDLKDMVKVRYSDITLLPKCSVEQFIDTVDMIHSERY